MARTDESGTMGKRPPEATGHSNGLERGFGRVVSPSGVATAGFIPAERWFCTTSHAAKPLAPAGFIPVGANGLSRGRLPPQPFAPTGINPAGATEVWEAVG